jgi:beta-galactosidase
MAASAVHFRAEDNYTDRGNRSKHTYQFKTCNTTVVSLDAATRGLGKASCGPEVLERYELRMAPTSFRFFIRPLTSSIIHQTSSLARYELPMCSYVQVERLANGRIKMTTPTKNAEIYYSIDGGEYQKYTTLITHVDACTIQAYCTADGLLSSPVATYVFDYYVNKSAWKLVSADSQHSGNEAKMAFDGKNNTFWHTEYQGSEPQCPHTLIVDMSALYKVTAFTYLARQDGSQNGMVKAYEVYLSTDGQTWGTAVATGEFKNTTSQQVATLKSATVGRYLKFVAKSEINGNAWTSAAEIGIQAEADVTAIDQVTKGNPQAAPGVYDLQGHKLTAPTARKGIYLSKGKKVLR